MANWFPLCFTVVTVNIVNLFFHLQGNKWLHSLPGRERYYWFMLHNRRVWCQLLIHMSKDHCRILMESTQETAKYPSLAGDNSIFCINVYLHYLQRHLFALYNYLSCIFREIMMLNVSWLPTAWNSDWKYPDYSYSYRRSRICHGHSIEMPRTCIALA